MTEKKYIVALDQGTTSSRAVVMDHDANIVSVSQRELSKFILSQAGQNTTRWKFGRPKAQRW